MVHKLIKNKLFLPFILAVISAVIYFTNTTPNTFLIGWDNVMPELNPMLNIKRGLFSVWQEYRGLGVYDGMAHAANLIHSLFVASLTLVLPQSSIRYFVLTLLHLIGGLGMYYLVNLFVKKKPKKQNIG